MTCPSVDDLPEEATSTLLGVCAQLSLLAASGSGAVGHLVSDALLVRLVSVSTGVRVDGATSEPISLTTLAAAELDGLHALLLASDDASVVRWCTRMNGLIVADLYRRELEQAAIDAKIAAIVAE